MLWSELQDRVSVAFPSTLEGLKSRALKYLELAQEDFAYHTGCYERNRVVYVDANQAKIPLPSDFISIQGQVEYRGAVIPYNPQIGVRSRRLSDSTYETGLPKEYFIDGMDLIFVPVPDTGGLMAFKYKAKPGTLTDSATAYKKLHYDGLTTGMFRAGDTLLGRTSGVTATVVEDINDNLRGVLTLTDVVLPTNVTTFANDEILVTTNENTDMWETLSGDDWEDITTAWEDLGLGAKAVANGNLIAHATAGDSPVIPSAYHHFLMEYAKAMLYEDEGETQRSDRQLQRYYSNRNQVFSEFEFRQTGGLSNIVDEIDGQIISWEGA